MMFVFLIILVSHVFANLRDLSLCKVSHLGVEYKGYSVKTESGIRCQAWDSAEPIHKVDNSLVDELFPDGSKRAAKSYCRNPNRDPKGPWCYTMDINLINETCDVPLCSYSDCRITGPGIEFSGQHSKGISGRHCLKWDKTRKRVKEKGKLIKQTKYLRNRFPERDLAEAKRFCRNPNGDIGGPWCFVDVEDSDEVERDYCSIPFCDNQDCMVFSVNNSTYSHYTNFNNSLTNFTFGLKIWDSDSFLNANARLVLTVLALPVNTKQIHDMGIGIEIVITNKFTALTAGNAEKIEYEPIANLLKSTEFTFFSLHWVSGFVSLTKQGQPKSLFLAEYKLQDNLLGFKKDVFKYYSFQGTNILWSFPFCDNDEDCDVHTTALSSFQQFWPLHETSVGHDLKFHVRAFHSASILLLSSPVISYPQLKIVLYGRDNTTRITTVAYENAPRIVLKEIDLGRLIRYWEWSQMVISIFADVLQLYLVKDVGTHKVIEVKHENIHKMRWFSPSSDNSVAHWTFYCKPPSAANPPASWPPECALNKDEPNYKGTQDVTSDGYPCLPWSGLQLLPKSAEDLFNSTEIYKNVNYCRDPKKELQGTYCYVIKYTPDMQIEKNYCRIRRCKSSDCRIAGTGNDYVGSLNVTRSNRSCVKWVEYISKYDISNKNLLNDTLYPDMSAAKAENFCRNPSRSIAGSWCYTTDGGRKDICNIKDCSKPEECIILIAGNAESRFLYILPQWKEAGIYGGLHFALKGWNPDIQDGVAFEIYSRTFNNSLELLIGAENNEKIKLFLNKKLLEDKTLPHLIAVGKWVSFWLQIRKGEILLGYESLSYSLFEWKSEDIEGAFDPAFLSYKSIGGNPIGFFFKCDDCHTEITSSKHYTKILPIGLWSLNESLVYNSFILNIRGDGEAFIPLMNLPEEEEYYEVQLNYQAKSISIHKQTTGRSDVLMSKQFNKPILTTNSWARYVISFNELQLNITMNNTLMLFYTSPKPLIFYWFSVAANKGFVIWTANCNPPDIDGPPLNGGWSPWSQWHCTVSCGGGEGFRARTCSNPRPNIFGKLCEGPHSTTGVCNDFQCGDISPNTLEMIRNHLQMQNISYEVEEGKSVLLKNDNELLSIFEIESPKSFYEWTLNGIIVTTDTKHIIFEDDNILLKYVTINDAGVYVCMLYRINKERVVFRVISLTVVGATTITARVNDPLILKSNAVVLGYIYSDLSQKWLLNDTIYIDHGIVSLVAVSTERLILNMSHIGTWKCVIEQSDLGLSWTTNLIKVKVNRAPSFYTHLMEDHITASVFSWLKTEENVKIAIVVIVVFTCVIVIVAVWFCLRWGTLPTRKGDKKEGADGITIVYRSMWRLTKGKKVEVAMKVIKHDCCEKYLKIFLDLTGQWAFLHSSAIVRLYGITLSSPLSMVMEYMRLGPLDQYLRKNKAILKTEDLIEAASNLASALWHLEENGIVHGKIRCRKLLVSCHEENTFTVKLGNPGINHTYASTEVHWIPIECYSNLEFAKRSTAADVWAFGTTIWEIFMYGEPISGVDHLEAMRYYLSGKRLPSPPDCPNMMYQILKECWNSDPHCRKQPQALMRDINQILYQVYNSRKMHSYAQVSQKQSKSISTSASTNSLFSNSTDITAVIHDETDIEQTSFATNFEKDGSLEKRWLFNSQEFENNEDTLSCFSSIFPNLNFSVATSDTSLDSISSMQSIFELGGDCNVILQGRIGQGFYGEVYKGTLEYLNDQDKEPRKVAVKKLKKTALSTCLQDFEREICIMKTLKHPNIVEILGVLQEPEVSLVMEYVTHGSLQSYLKIYHETLTLKQLLKYALDIAKGMHYLGAKHIVHRDLAARNILVVDENHVKISDFGLAQVMGPNEYYILQTNRELPIKWYAPESLRDGKFSPRSDVWSYGVTMCEMFGQGEEPRFQTTCQVKSGQEQQILLETLESGIRFPCPNTCPQGIYVLMIYPCWHSDPHKRPTFDKLCSEAEELLIQQ